MANNNLYVEFEIPYTFTAIDNVLPFIVKVPSSLNVLFACS